MFRHKGFLKLLTGICLMLAFAPQSAAAAEGVMFSVKAVPGGKQVSDVSYFDLRLSPGEEYVLEVDIFNNSENPMDASVTATTAGTNSSGVIEYDNLNVTDDSLKVSFAEAATVDSSLISVPAAGKSRARINVKMPDILFDGTMLGGIVIKKVEPTGAVSGGGTSIQNEYCYVLAVKISVSDNSEQPEFRLRSVGAGLSNYNTSIVANLQNYHAAIAKDAEISAEIYYNNEVKYSKSSEGFDVAPNSNFDYTIPCSGKLDPGDYRLLLTVTHEDRVWEFDENFSITGRDANNINGQAVNVPGVNYYFIATICLSLILIILLVIILWKRLKKRKDDEEPKS